MGEPTTTEEDVVTSAPVMPAGTYPDGTYPADEPVVITEAAPPTEPVIEVAGDEPGEAPPSSAPIPLDERAVAAIEVGAQALVKIAEGIERLAGDFETTQGNKNPDGTISQVRISLANIFGFFVNRTLAQDQMMAEMQKQQQAEAARQAADALGLNGARGGVKRKG